MRGALSRPALHKPIARLWGCRRSGKDPRRDEEAYRPEGARVETVTGEMVCVRRPVDLKALRPALQAGLRTQPIKDLTAGSALLCIGRTSGNLPMSQILLAIA